MTGHDPQWVDLAERLESAGRAFVIPGSTPAVRLARLHADPGTRASVNVVSFPPGWRRPGEGHYLAGEEFVLLRGDLVINGEQYTSGDWVWIPPLTARVDSGSGAGALALAWFSGPASWRAGAGDRGNQPCRASVSELRPLRRPTPDVPGESAVRTLPAAQPADADCDLLDFAAQRWCFVAAGALLPPWPAPVMLRRWS